MDNRKLILHYEDDYADEFDVKGYVVINKTQYDNIMIYMEKYFDVNKSFEWYFGSNESIKYRDFDTFFQAFNTTLINDDEFHVLRKLGLTEFGHSPIDLLVDMSYIEE